jgi:hypothetical protein
MLPDAALDGFKERPGGGGVVKLALAKIFYDFCGVIDSLCYIPAPSKGRGFVLLRKTVKVKRI